MIDREKVIKGLEIQLDDLQKYANADEILTLTQEQAKEILALLKEQDAVVHPEPSCEITYITDCCCDLCGVQLIREDKFCRCCGKPIVWEGQ